MIPYILEMDIGKISVKRLKDPSPNHQNFPPIGRNHLPIGRRYTLSDGIAERWPEIHERVLRNIRETCE